MIIVYDVNVERVAKICQYLRRYLDWVQNSVFEGELTDSQYKRIKHDLKEIMHEDEDSVRFYSFRTKEQEFQWDYMDETQRRVIEFGLDSGFGERISLGFGFVNKI